jgi:hypothetical protein
MLREWKPVRRVTEGKRSNLEGTGTMKRDRHSEFAEQRGRKALPIGNCLRARCSRLIWPCWWTKCARPRGSCKWNWQRKRGQRNRRLPGWKMRNTRPMGRDLCGGSRPTAYFTQWAKGWRASGALGRTERAPLFLGQGKRKAGCTEMGEIKSGTTYRVGASDAKKTSRPSYQTAEPVAPARPGTGGGDGRGADTSARPIRLG